MHELHERGGQEALREIAAAVLVGPLAQVDAREMQQVEGEVRNGRRAIRVGEFRGRLQLSALLQRAERGLAVRIEGDHFAIEEHPVHVLARKVGHERREERRIVQSFARAQLHAVGIDERLDAVAVELGFPHPLGLVEDLVTDFREHGRELGGHRLLRAGGNEVRGRNAMRGDHLHFRHRDSREHRAVLLGHVALGDKAVLVLDEQPLLRFLRSHEREGPLQLLAAQREAELSLRDAVEHFAFGARPIVVPRLATFIGRVHAAIPDDHLTGAILPGRNDALEGRVVVGMVFGLHGEPLFATIQRRTLGNGPRLEHAIAFEAEVVVQARGGMLLHDEEQRAPAIGGEGGGGLWRRAEGALGRVFLEVGFRHGGILE